MKDALLVASSNPFWREALQLELDAVGIDTVLSSDAASAIQALEALNCNAAIVDEHMRAGRAGAAQLGAIYVARVIRGAYPELPILFLATAAFEAGTRFARDHPPAEVIVNAHLDSDRPGRIRDALDWLKRWAALASHPADSASIEIDVGESQVTVTVDREPGGRQPPEVLEWAGRNRLGNLAQLFRIWRPYQPDPQGPRPTDYWQQTLHGAGKDLFETLRLGAFGTLQDCLAGVADQERIHFRFNVHDDDDLIHVPFELIHHQVAHNTFMREVSPVARRLVLKSGGTFRRISDEPRGEPGSVLCILSDVWGTLSVPDCTFGGQPRATFNRLKGLEGEWQAIKAAQEAANNTCSRFDLLPGDPIDALKTELEKGWEVIHFSGHSILADDGKSVFLVLPGKANSSRLQALPVRSFADLASDAGAQLVILSSCESSSVEAIIRLAQYGISTVIGFRWEVLDNGARLFTSELHRRLAKQEPIGRAFVRALKDVMMREPNTPTFASPLLLVQSDRWAGSARTESTE